MGERTTRISDKLYDELCRIQDEMFTFNGVKISLAEASIIYYNSVKGRRSVPEFKFKM